MTSTLRLLVAASTLTFTGVACSGEMTVEREVAATVDVSGDAACQDTFEDVLGAIGGGLDGMVEAVPEEIRADVRLLVDTYGDIAGIWLQTGEADDSARDAPEVQAAEERVLEWLETHCAEPDPGSDGATTLDERPPSVRGHESSSAPPAPAGSRRGGGALRHRLRW